VVGSKQWAARARLRIRGLARAHGENALVLRAEAARRFSARCGKGVRDDRVEIDGLTERVRALLGWPRGIVGVLAVALVERRWKYEPGADAGRA
jgi:hypothetical protein